MTWLLGFIGLNLLLWLVVALAAMRELPDRGAPATDQRTPARPSVGG